MYRRGDGVASGDGAIKGGRAERATFAFFERTPREQGFFLGERSERL